MEYKPCSFPHSLFASSPCFQIFNWAHCSQTAAAGTQCCSVVTMKLQLTVVASCSLFPNWILVSVLTVLCACSLRYSALQLYCVLYFLRLYRRHDFIHLTTCAKAVEVSSLLACNCSSIEEWKIYIRHVNWTPSWATKSCFIYSVPQEWDRTSWCSSNTLDLGSGGSRVEYQPGYRLLWLKIFVVSPSTSMCMPDRYRQMGHICFLPYCWLNRL